MRISDWSSDVCSSDLAQFPLESVSLVEIARDVVSLLATGIIAEGKDITLDAGSGHPVARGRPEAIAAALRQLMANAEPGRGSGRARVRQQVYMSVVAVSINKQ